MNSKSALIGEIVSKDGDIERLKDRIAVRDAEIERLTAENERLRSRNAALVESLRAHRCLVDGRATVGECQQCGCIDGLLISGDNRWWVHMNKAAIADYPDLFVDCPGLSLGTRIDMAEIWGCPNAIHYLASSELGALPARYGAGSPPPGRLRSSQGFQP